MTPEAIMRELEGKDWLSIAEVRGFLGLEGDVSLASKLKKMVDDDVLEARWWFAFPESPNRNQWQVRRKGAGQ